MKYEFTPTGVCSKKIYIDAEDGIVNDVVFLGGCNGNLKGIGALIKGMSVEEAVDRLSGIRCGMKTTSCPDQLAKALKELL
ncbi:MAG: TIGR03905 family TSCPD domain-containing protein [Ruminococcus sp.]|nr:TIGR03905 family TSCPD domain-containing protein [Ruminococcus sp.]